MKSAGCVKCQKTMDEAEMQMTIEGLLCSSCASKAAADDVPQPGLASPIVIAAAVVGCLPFVVHVSSSSTTSTTMTLDGKPVQQVAASRAVDYVALGAGGLAAVLGVVALLSAIKSLDRRTLRLAIAAGAGLLGVLQVVRGLGVF